MDMYPIIIIVAFGHSVMGLDIPTVAAGYPGKAFLSVFDIKLLNY